MKVEDMAWPMPMYVSPDGERIGTHRVNRQWKRVEVAPVGLGSLPELMGAYEACQLLGVQSGNLRKTAGLPEPVQELRMGSIWRAEDIRRFASERAA